MSFTLILEVTIGLVLIFSLFSLLCTVLLELLSGYFNRRGRMLESAFYEVFDDMRRPQRGLYRHFLIGDDYISESDSDGAYRNSLARRLLRYPLIRAHFEKNRLPSELSPEIVGDAVLALAEEEAGVSPITKDYQHSIDNLTESLRILFRTVAPEDGLSRVRVRDRLARFYEDAMERVNGRYKRTTQAWLFCIGALVALVFNVNTIRLTDSIAADAELRQRLTAAAEDNQRLLELQKTVLQSCVGGEGEERCSQATIDNAKEDLQALQKRIDLVLTEVDGLDLPIGWCEPTGGENETADATQSEGTSGASVSGASAMRPLNFSEVTTPGRAGLLPSVVSPDVAPAICPPWRVSVFSSEKWENYPFPNHLVDLAGILLTALAISLGAPFWFDLLSKLVKLRSAGGIRGGTPRTPEDAAPGGRSLSPGPVSDTGGMGSDQSAPFNAFEAQLTEDDIKDVQRAVGRPRSAWTGSLDAYDRAAIRSKQKDLNLDDSGAVTRDFFRRVL